MITKEEKAEFYRRLDVVLNYLQQQNVQPQQVMVVGSGALMTCGIPLVKAPHDIDLEVCCDRIGEKVFKALADLCGNTFYQIKENYPKEWKHKPYIFIIPDPKEGKDVITVNIWVVDKFSRDDDEIVWSHGVRFATAYGILWHKAQYKRLKDVNDITSVATEILELLK